MRVNKLSSYRRYETECSREDAGKVVEETEIDVSSMQSRGETSHEDREANDCKVRGFEKLCVRRFR